MTEWTDIPYRNARAFKNFLLNIKEEAHMYMQQNGFWTVQVAEKPKLTEFYGDNQSKETR